MSDDLQPLKLYRCKRCGARPVFPGHGCTLVKAPEEGDAEELVELEAGEAAMYFDPTGMKA